MAVTLSENALRVLEARYLRRDERGEVVETPDGLFRRVARGVAQAETCFDGACFAGQREEEFYDVLSNLEFLPNSPTLMNAGTALGQLSACFVLPVEDSMPDIFESLKLMALIQQSGGGTGFSFSRLRPRGDIVRSTGGVASGPVSFMRIFDCATENIRQGGRRRGANMGMLRVDHPDVREFIDAKRDGQSFRNFNLSVAITDAFMEAAAQDASFELIHPATKTKVATVSAVELLSDIGAAAWATGDPGMVFIDAVNRANPTPEAGPIEATNPCGEVPLLPYEACNLGSINLSRMVRRAGDGHTIDWAELARTTRLGIRFLDNVIEVGHWPDPRIDRIVRANRKVGLGVMGFAELLILLETPYGSDRAAGLAEEIMQFIATEAVAASQELADERGEFPNWKRSVYAGSGARLRNATRTSIAPTGTIGIIAGTSAGIEPLFALAYRRRHVLNGQTLVERNPLFLKHARQHGLDEEQLTGELLQRGSLADVSGVSEVTRSLFRTALEIPPEAHLRIQAAFQRHVDNAVSKTINLPASATAESITDIYRRAWELGLKGVTVYRYGSKNHQVLILGAGETLEQHEHFSHCDPHACKL
jgi:ribonucleoside-diphosphate reductase alpha chain